jgi:hypothetical protein
MFTVRLKLSYGETEDLNYANFSEFREDLQHTANATRLVDLLEKKGFVQRCEIYCGPKRIAGLPVIAVDRLREQIIANSAAILREYFKSGKSS